MDIITYITVLHLDHSSNYTVNNYITVYKYITMLLKFARNQYIQKYETKGYNKKM